MAEGIYNNVMDEMLDFVRNQHDKFDSKIIDYNYKINIAAFIEQLLFFDQVYLKIDRCTLALAHIIDKLGVKQTLNFLEDEPIKFVQVCPHFFYPSESIYKRQNLGIGPGYTTEKNRDPKVILDNTSYVYGIKIPIQERKKFIDYIERNKILVNEESGNLAYKLFMSAFESDFFGEFGFKNTPGCYTYSHEQLKDCALYFVKFCRRLFL